MKRSRARGLTQLGSRVPLPAAPGEAWIETFPNPSPGRAYAVRFDCPEFTSLCPVTGQPDFGRIVVEYEPGARCIESKSLKLYLGSFRTTGSFAEEVVNRIRDDLVRACRPRRLIVTGEFSARGGISIRVVSEHGARSKR